MSPHDDGRRASSLPSVQITRVGPSDWERFRAMRLASLEDAPEMFGSTLDRERAFTEEEWRRRAGRPVSFFASRDGRDIGLAGVYEVDGTWCVMGMWITPSSRGTGVVDALTRACESFVRDAGSTAVSLGVMEDNAPGISAYRRLGYQFTGHREHVRGGREEVWMTKALA